MTDPISYESAGVSVREDLAAAHQQAFDRLSGPGAWWTGAERIAIAAEVRNAAVCPLCRDRKLALSASAVDGKHATLGDLGPAAVEVIHRVTTDPGRLSKSWFDSVISQGLSHGEYVEIISIVVVIVTIDSFCYAIGVAQNPLPDPVEGEPSHYRPEGLVDDVAWVPVLDPDRVAAAESDLFPGSRTGNVIRALSLIPDVVRDLRPLSAAHYMNLDDMLDFSKGLSIDRMQVEFIAGRVSALNECFY